MKTIHGKFVVRLTPMAFDTVESDIARMEIHKTFEGAITGESQGQMLSYRSPVEGSAAYVAIEKVVGTVDGKKGSFVLAHRGLMDRSFPTLHLDIVADSGTDELEGISGEMDIDVVDGDHTYALRYELP